LQSVASTGSLSIQEIRVSVGLVLAFIVGALFIGSKTVPKFVDIIGKTNHHDLVIVAVLGVAFGLSFIANEIGISVATGAFFAGVLVAESKSHAVARVLSMPLRDMFAALFFVSVGALMDISLLPLFIIPALILIATSFAAKFTTVYFSAKLLRTDKRTSMKAGFALSASGGELALEITKGGADVGATSSLILPMVGTLTIITTFLSPHVIKFGWKLANSPRQPKEKDEAEEEKGEEEKKKDDLPSRSLDILQSCLKGSTNCEASDGA
jgi:CPA2 family monovalent cation:H+ antiporter-2